MPGGRSGPDLSFVIPAANENRWSDLLASLVSTDPQPLAGPLGVEVDRVLREVVVPGAEVRRWDRLDLLVLDGERQVAAIEVKLLSDLGRQQLARYRRAFADAESCWVLHLGQAPVNHRSAPGWRSLTWEAVLTAYAGSQHPWVATTARAWLDQLASLVPPVDSGTVWNDVPDDAAGFELALRARVAWLAQQMDGWCTLGHDLSQSSGGGAWVAAMRAPTGAGEHSALAELQEGLAVRDWGLNPHRPYCQRLLGPVVLVGLSQTPVTTSAGFDWLLLHRLFRRHVLDDQNQPVDGRPWQTTSASPRNTTDRTGWLSVVEAGAPRWLGKGYGMATTATHQICAFGARLQLAPTLTLGQVDAEMRDLEVLVREMAAEAGDPFARSA